MTPRLRLAFARNLITWYRTNGRTFPWRETHDPFRLLVAEILLQRTPYWKVRPAYEALISLAPTPAALAQLSADGDRGNSPGSIIEIPQVSSPAPG